MVGLKPVALVGQPEVDAVVECRHEEVVGCRREEVVGCRHEEVETMAIEVGEEEEAAGEVVGAGAGAGAGAEEAQIFLGACQHDVEICFPPTRQDLYPLQY